MKKLLTIIALAVIGLSAEAQTFPYGINYQAVARDAYGNARINQQVNVQFYIHKSTANGTVVYQETDTTHTNSNGQYSLVIGNGYALSGTAGTLSGIDWAADKYYLGVGIYNTGTYNSLGTPQLIESVPYAMYARKSDTSNVAKSSQWSDYAIYEGRYLRNALFNISLHYEVIMFSFVA